MTVSEVPARDGGELASDSARVLVSIVVPVYNEARLLPGLLNALLRCCGDAPRTEIVISENGSTDGSSALCAAYAAQHDAVVLVCSPVASYGAALVRGIGVARGDVAVIIKADLWSEEFYAASLALLDRGADVIVGSKRLVPSLDHRSAIRRFITWAFNGVLRWAFGFKGTDTHGLKAFRTERLRPLIGACTTARELFDTELMLRAQYAGLRVVELPIEVNDTRPARLSLVRRVLPTLIDLAILFVTLRPQLRREPSPARPIPAHEPLHGRS